MQIASCDALTKNWNGNNFVWLISSVDSGCFWELCSVILGLFTKRTSVWSFQLRLDFASSYSHSRDTRAFSVYQELWLPSAANGLQRSVRLGTEMGEAAHWTLNSVPQTVLNACSMPGSVLVRGLKGLDLCRWAAVVWQNGWMTGRWCRSAVKAQMEEWKEGSGKSARADDVSSASC